MKSKVKEIFIMRAFACASVVFLHSIAVVQQLYPLSPITHTILRTMQLLLLFSTPMFVFISEFVLSYSYNTELPKGFFKKRFQYILVPYIFFGIFYGIQWAFSYSVDSPHLILKQIFLYIFRGDYHGYFVLIIFQFYFLHKLLGRLLNQLNIKAMLLISLLFNIGYLAFFNYTIWSDYVYIPFARYFWTRGYFMVFPAWIFYFILAYYAGQHMEHLQEHIRRYKWMIFTSVPLFGLIILLQYKLQILTVISTKRPDIVPYTFVVILIAYYIASRFSRISPSINIINRCSYSIYLIHPFFQLLLQNILMKTKFIENPYLALIIVFAFSLYLPILTTIFVNKWIYGYLFVGKLGPSGREESPVHIPLLGKLYLPYLNIFLKKKNFKETNAQPSPKK